MNDLITTAEAIRTNNAFAPIDRAIGDFLARFSGATDSIALAALFSAGALTSAALRTGATAFDLGRTENTYYPAETESGSGILVPSREVLLPVLLSADCTKCVSSHPAERPAPLILMEEKIAFHRYYHAEEIIAAGINIRLQPMPVPNWEPGHLSGLSSRFANEAKFSEADPQTLALAILSTSRFAILTGGPGTGKTTVVAALLAEELSRNPTLKVSLAAPTGKAQSRLRAAILDELPLLHIPPETAAAISAVPCSTLHKLLSNDLEQSLSCELLLIDEASMVSTALMAKLFRRLSANTRLILIGDPDQLPSVECGAVLTDLCTCAVANRPHFECQEHYSISTGQITAGNAESLPNAAPLTGNVAKLTKFHRFATAPNIGKIGAMIRETESLPSELAQEMMHLDEPDFSSYFLNETILNRKLDQILHQRRIKAFGIADLPFLARTGNPDSLHTAFLLLDSFQLLAPMRTGRFGIEKMDALMREKLEISGLYEPGSILLIRENDPVRDLWNGDIGLVVRTADGTKRVFFDDCGRSFSTMDLPPHESAFALTVHKSQGSGYDTVLLVLPETDSPLLTRELIYTGITRARKRVELFASESSLASALTRHTERSGHLRTMLKQMF